MKPTMSRRKAATLDLNSADLQTSLNAFFSLARALVACLDMAASTIWTASATIRSACPMSSFVIDGRDGSLG